MNAIRLWLGKDVRRLALWLAAWGVVLVVRVAGALGWGPSGIFVRAAIDNGAWLAATVLFVLVSALVVLEDPPIEPTAFWPTRMISARQLFLEKALFVLVLLVIPATAIDALEVAVTGIDRHFVVLSVPESLLDWTVWGAAVMMLAALATSLVGVLAGVVRLAVVPIALAFMLGTFAHVTRQSWLMPFGLFMSGQDVPTLAALAASRALAVRVGILLVALGITAWIYARRHRQWAWAVVYGFAFALLLGWSVWRWTFVPTHEPAVAAVPAGLTVALDRVAHPSSDSSFRQGKSPHEKDIDGVFTFSGLPPMKAVGIGQVTGTLSYPGRIYHLDSDATDFEPSWDGRAIEELLAGARVLNPEGAAISRKLLRMPDDDFAARRTQPGRLDANVTVVVRRYEVTADVPVVPGARVVRGGQDLSIDTMTLQNGSCVISASGTQVTLLLAPESSSVRRMAFIRFDPSVLYVLRNRRRGEALLPDHLLATGFGWARSRVDKEGWLFNFNGILTGAARSMLDDDWMRDADLVRIEAVTEGAVTQHVSINDFAIDRDATLEAPNAGPAPRSEALLAYDPTTDPTRSLGTLDDGALMALDWYGPTRRDAGMAVTARRDIPGPGIELDVRVDASPRAAPRIRDVLGYCFCCRRRPVVPARSWGPTFASTSFSRFG